MTMIQTRNTSGEPEKTDIGLILPTALFDKLNSLANLLNTTTEELIVHALQLFATPNNELVIQAEGGEFILALPLSEHSKTFLNEARGTLQAILQDGYEVKFEYNPIPGQGNRILPNASLNQARVG